LDTIIRYTKTNQMSSTNMIQLSNTFEPSSVVFSKMKKNKNGGKTVYINTADGKGKL
jgi:hypothetical protein